MGTSRREFIKKTTQTLGFLPFLHLPHQVSARTERKGLLAVNIFSKHLQFLDYEAVGEKAAEMGFSGVDLTVRSKGHVLPENVETDLPKAVEQIRKGGSKCALITTAIENIRNPLDVKVLQVAAEQGIQYYRTNWFKYAEATPMEETLETYQKQIKALGKFNKKHGLIGCYQNHAGTSIGASIWEIEKLLESADSDYFGVQYDIRHAVVEGGLSWENGLRWIRPRIKTIVLKDFKWGQVNGQWKPIHTPIGQGMVDFKKYFGLLKKYQIDVPVCLHVEYPMGGAEHGDKVITIDQKIVFETIRKDLEMIQQFWEEA